MSFTIELFRDGHLKGATKKFISVSKYRVMHWNLRDTMEYMIV